MEVKPLPIRDLLVNRANDRHGELIDEQAAIEWLLSKRAAHMRNLTKDIVKSAGIYEAPLIHRSGRQFIVYDGNRRVTCMKLLADPHKAPTQEWATFFTEQRAEWEGAFPSTVECQIEDDLERIDEILFRRHTGGQSGVGQSAWDAEAKSNFQRRTGKANRVNLAEEVEAILRQSGHLQHIKKKLPRSNFNRLLSSEGLRNRVGISLEKNQLKMTHSPEKVTSALVRIANDLISSRITLEKIWSNTGKKEYLDNLEREGMLPTVHDVLPAPKKAAPAKNSEKVSSKPAPAPKPAERRTLIRDIDYGVIPSARTQRAIDIWNELQFRLKFGEHDNAIAVLFRVLLELAVGHYVDVAPVQGVFPNDKLKHRFEKSVDHMHSEGALSKEGARKLKSFLQRDPIISTVTLNAYVHDANFFPSDQHLKSMWDTLADFIVHCLNTRNTL